MFTLALALVLAQALALSPAPASVNGKPITEPEVVKAMRDHVRKTLFHRQLDEQQTAEVRKKVLETLLTAELRAQEARRRGLLVPQEPVEQVAAGEEAAAGGKQKFAALLAANGIDRARYLEVIARDALAEKLVAVEADRIPPVTEAEALAHYQTALQDYQVPGAMRLRSTCVRVDPSSNTGQWQAAAEEARALRERALAGDFAAIAVAQKCDAFAAKGGDFGVVHQGSLDPAMEKAAWAVADGEITAPVRSLRGWYLLKRESSQPQRQATFAEVKESIQVALRSQRQAASLATLDAQLRKAAKIIRAKE